MLYLFDKDENLIHELSSTDLSSIHQIEELDKLMVLEFGVYLNRVDWMDGIEYVAHRDFENPERIQMYRILTSEPDSNSMNYQAIHILFDELKSYGYIRDKRPNRAKASAALSEILSGTRWKVSRVDDSDLLSANFYDCTRLEALSKILTTWQMDLDFYLTFNGSRITGRYINLYKQRGEDTGERFVYGSNALEVVKELDKSEVYTRIIPRGKGEEKFDENGKPTDGHGRRIKIDEVVWSKTKGDPIDKPKGQEFIESVEMTKKFGFSDGEPRTKVQIFEDIEKPEDLIKAGYDFLIKASRPLVQFKTKVYKKSRTNVGDIVRVIRKDLDIYYRTRIYKANRNLLTGNVEVEFGDKLVTSQAERDKKLSQSLGALQDRIIETETGIRGSFVDKVTEELTNAMFNRDGYNYELKAGNKYNLPAGYYSFDREIDDNPQRVIYVGAGTLAIADSKKSNGDWNFRTFGTGQGFTADLLVAGTILGGKVRWNLEDGTFLIGNSPEDYNLYWDGSTLHLRNVDIDLENNRTIQDLKEKQNLTDQEVEKRKQEIIKANQSLESARADIEQANLDIAGTLEKLKQAREDFDRDIGAVSETVDQNKEDWEYRNKVVDEKLLDLNSRFTVTDGKIESSVKSIKETMEERIKVAKSDLEKYADDKDGLIAAQIDSKDKELRTYITENYSTKTQTDEKISQEVGSLKTLVNKDIGDLSKEITEAKSKIEQTKNSITAKVSEVEVDISDVKKNIRSLSTDVKLTKNGLESKVSANEIISKINQSPEAVKIKARNIDLTGYVSVRGDFTTYDSSDNVGIELKYNDIRWRDNRWENKTFGVINVSEKVFSSGEYSFMIGHYPTSQLSIAYYNNKYGSYFPYVTFDRWNYTGEGGSEHPVIFNEGVYIPRYHKLFLGDIVFETNVDGELKIHHKSRNAGVKIDSSAIYAYYASGGRDVNKEIARF
ncbi:phage tail spike protein [uncultured Anaerococcus sp.]|jgi:phage minor structural protein|uniref:phage tail spike protein n=1 Tax=uncultured Anaerococcus sp. TaxID=293428 RepID=UPI002804198B|nr:phage tail spike protein [uncultured Anaerococcus sp.]